MGELAPMAREIEAGVLATLAGVQRCREAYSLILGPAEQLNAEQNAQVVVSGEGELVLCGWCTPHPSHTRLRPACVTPPASPALESHMPRGCGAQTHPIPADRAAFFRGLYLDGDVATWNLRDQHMVQTCLRLTEHHANADGAPPKVLVWAHNSHCGDARATDLGTKRHEWNLGQMLRTTFGEPNVFIVGFGTYGGTVTAATEWGRPSQTFDLTEAEEVCGHVRPLLPKSLERTLGPLNGLAPLALIKHPGTRARIWQGSYSSVFHRGLIGLRKRLGPGAHALNACAVLLRSPRDDEQQCALREKLGVPRRQRAVGVSYKRAQEAVAHYVHASLTAQCDAWVHIDLTTALVPLTLA